MQIFQGIPASPGIAISRGVIYRPRNTVPLKKSVPDPGKEINRLRLAVQAAKQELEATYQSALMRVGEESAEIFHAHLMMLDDPELLGKSEQKILTEGINCEAAFYEVADEYALILQNLPDEYFRARAADIRDVARRVVRILTGEDRHAELLSVRSIILAEDLVPSDTMRFDRDLIAGFFTTHGGATSHTAILSRALGVPAVVGGEPLPDTLPEDTSLILDGDQGRLIINPDASTLVEYQKLIHKQLEIAEQEKKNAFEPTVTLDGYTVQVVANIGSLEDATRAISQGAEGVGLFRTEFAYIEQTSIPNEAGLVEFYKAIFQVFGDYPVIVRTLDIGGDKEVPHLNLPIEANPFLGVRGIRLCFKRMDLFRPQLRAILRAGVNSNIHIMFPMISSVADVRKARVILNQCMAELEGEALAYNSHPQVGIMIEVPAAAVCADQLAKEVDFFSIGTNDLTQYTLAADRTNANLAEWSTGVQPAVLRLIKQVIDYSHKAGIWTGMCGEMAGEPLAIPILLGFGLDEFSMNSSAIPKAKEIIRRWNTVDAQKLAERALQCETPLEVEQLVNNWKPLEG